MTKLHLTLTSAVLFSLLTGCQAPAMSPLAAVPTTKTIAPMTKAVRTVQPTITVTPGVVDADVSEGQAVEEELDLIDYMAEAEAGYQVQGFFANLKDRVSGHTLWKKLGAKVRENLMERKAKRDERLERRLEARKDFREAFRQHLKQAAWVDNGDGTRTKTTTFDVTVTVDGKTAERHVNLSLTQNAETHAVVHAKTELTGIRLNGATGSAVREKTLQEDGSYQVTLHRAFTLTNGTTRVGDWAKTIAADGRVSGTGTITWTNAEGAVIKTVEVGLNGSEDALEAELSAEA